MSASVLPSPSRSSRPGRIALASALASLLLSGVALRDGGERPLVHWQTPDPALALAFSADGTVLAVGGEGRLQLYNTPGLDRPAHLGQFQAPACTLRDFAFAGTSLQVYARRRDCAGRIVASSSRGRRLQPGADRLALYDLATGSLAATPGPHAGELGAIRVHAGGQIMASASVDGLVRFWQVGGMTEPGQRTRGQLLRSLRLPAVTTPRRLSRPVAFDPQLELLAVHDWRDYYMAIVEVESGRVLHKTEYPFRAIAQPLFVFSPDGGSYFDGQRVRRSRSGEPVATIAFDFAGPPPTRAAFAPDGQSLAVLYSSSGAGLSHVRVFALPSMAVAGTAAEASAARPEIIASYALAEDLRSLAWRNNSDSDSTQKILAVGSYSGRVFLYRP